MKNSIYCFKQEKTNLGTHWRLTGVFGEKLPIEQLLELVNPNPSHRQRPIPAIDIDYEEILLDELFD